MSAKGGDPAEKNSHTGTVGTAEFEGAIERIQSETTVSRLLGAASIELVELLGASRCVISKVIGDLIVELSEHEHAGADRPLELFLLSDYPLTQEVLESGAPRVVLRDDPDADGSETALLERLGFDSLVMAPLCSQGRNWGLVEIYAGARGFDDDQIKLAVALLERLGELLAELENAA